MNQPRPLLVPDDVDPAALAAEYARRHDDETAEQALIIKRLAYPKLIRAKWVIRQEGADGLGIVDQPRRGMRLIHSVARYDDGHIWSHVSVSRRDRILPTWEQVRDVYWLIHPDVYGVIVVAPPDQHVNKGEVAHVWGCLTQPAVPDFTHQGHI